MINPRLYGVVFTFIIFFASFAQQRTDSVAIHFRQSKINLDTAYMGNGESLDYIKHKVSLYNQTDSNFILRDVKIIGAASPEGSIEFNKYLSHQRALRIFDYLQSQISFPDSITESYFLGRDWRGLLEAVETDAGVPYREDVIELLNEIICRSGEGEKESAHNLQRLKRLHGGKPYLYMYRSIFPRLRQANVVLTFTHPVMKMEPIGEMHYDIPSLPLISVGAIPLRLEQAPGKPFYMALKSNLIADVLALPEIGAEFYLGKGLSVVGNWMYGWWDNDASHRYWRAYGGDVALRWWFGKAARQKPLTGHHVGVYGGVVTYDFEFGGKGYMGGRPGHNLWDRCMHYAGIEYGYSLPIARRWNLDFTLGMGYLGGKYEEYVPKGHCYQWKATKQKHWFGPTKLEVSLVWLIGRGNYNMKGVKK